MLSKIAGNVVSGAIGLLALYVVARLAYKAGTDMANMENHYKSVAKKTSDLEHQNHKLSSVDKERIEAKEPVALDEAKPEKPIAEDEIVIVKDVGTKNPIRKGGFLGRLGWMTGRGKTGVIKELLRNPEEHRMEACVNDGAVDIRISKRGT